MRQMGSLRKRNPLAGSMSPTDSIGSGSGGRSPASRRTHHFFGGGGGLTRDDLQDELKTFADEALFGAVERAILEGFEKFGDSLRQIYQDAALTGAPTLHGMPMAVARTSQEGPWRRQLLLRPGRSQVVASEAEGWGLEGRGVSGGVGEGAGLAPERRRGVTSPKGSGGRPLLAEPIVSLEGEGWDAIPASARPLLLREPEQKGERKADYMACVREKAAHFDSGQHDVDHVSEDDRLEGIERTCERLRRLLSSHTFEHFVAFLVILNGALLGFEADHHASHPEREVPGFVRSSEMLFCTVFVMELLLRLSVFRRAFFTQAGWPWNIFDLLVVALQVVEQVSGLFTDTRDLAAMQVLRTLRLLRITRLLRALRLIEELRTIVSSVAKSMRSLLWSLVLLMIMVYTVSVIFTEVVTEAVVKQTSNAEALRYWFGGVGRTVLSLFETILGGVSWDSIVQPLITDVSPVAGAVFCLYVTFSQFALMNVVTGIFVEKATRTAQENKDQYMANHISEIFFQGSHKSTDNITLDAFKAHLDNPDMQDYFKAIDVDPSEATGLFHLLDAGGSGSIHSEQFVDGLLRLRGSARALDLALLMHDNRLMHEDATRRIAHLHRTVMTSRNADSKGRAEPPVPSDPQWESAETPTVVADDSWRLS